MSFSKHLSSIRSSRFLSLIWLVRGSENIQHSTFFWLFFTECAAEISGWGKKNSTITVIKKKSFKWFVFNLIGLKFSNIFNCTHAKMIDHQPCCTQSQVYIYWYFFSFSPDPAAVWMQSSMDLRIIRLTALSIVQSQFWIWSPRMSLVPPKKAPDCIWMLSNQLSEAAFNTVRARMLISELQFPRVLPDATSPEIQSSPAFWRIALFRRSSTLFLT